MRIKDGMLSSIHKIKITEDIQTRAFAIDRGLELLDRNSMQEQERISNGQWSKKESFSLVQLWIWILSGF
jgi:hypothetical protein